MQKLGVLLKESLRNRIKDHLKDSSGVFVIKYSKLSSPDLTALRQILKDSQATLFITKNTVAARTIKDSEFESISRYIEGNCGLIFVKDEPVNICRVLYNFAKTHEHLKVEGGLMGTMVLESKDIEAISKLPTKEVLRAQVVITLKSPIRGLACVLNQALRKFVYCLDQIKNKKEKESKQGGQNGK